MKVGGYGMQPSAIWRQQLAALRQQLPTQAAAAAAPKGAERVGPTVGGEGLRPSAAGAAAAEAASGSFADILTKAVHSDRAARAAVDTYVRGEKPLHETMLAVTKADISLRLMVNVRNKLLNAYQEVMRMS